MSEVDFKSGMSAIKNSNTMFSAGSQSALNRMFPTRNLFFRQLTGKAQGTPSVERAANWLLAPALSALALPSTWLGAAFKRGGTLIFVSQKS
jgi:hypothetical protein